MKISRLPILSFFSIALGLFWSQAHAQTFNYSGSIVQYTIPTNGVYQITYAGHPTIELT